MDVSLVLNLSVEDHLGYLFTHYFSRVLLQLLQWWVITNQHLMWADEGVGGLHPVRSARSLNLLTPSTKPYAQILFVGELLQ